MWILGLLWACAPPEEAAAAGCTDGIDMDGDGICDREGVDWSAEARLTPGEDRGNIYQLDPDDLAVVREAGLRHALVWPVTATRMLLPYGPMMSAFEDPESAGLRALMDSALGFSSEEGLYDRMGLARFPAPDETLSATSPYRIPLPAGMVPGDPIGAAVLETDLGAGMTFSCATCHVGSLFGRPVVGLTTRRPRPNALFHFARLGLSQMTPETFQELTHATDGEVVMFEELVAALAVVGTQEPVALGLDTSLAQVALSLAHRSPDADASLDPFLADNPASTLLDALVADSKPMVWWTLRHKTRWLSDGAIRSGNPILTNFLWNELGRGVDLAVLADWLESPAGGRVVDELTVAVFAAEAPRWTDFFPADSIDEDLARTGEGLFNARCASCHGTYEKGWSAPDADTRDAVARLETTRVVYHAQTPRLDVGTDPQRAAGMVALETLNRLTISAEMGTVVEATGEVGYVPPPLDGIWARYPYLHNNAVPTLCDLLSPAAERPDFFVQGPADDPETDFDADCVGYPTGDAVPAAWLEDTEAHYTADAPGQSRQGHEEMLYDADGTLAVGPTERAALVAYLKTL